MIGWIKDIFGTKEVISRGMDAIDAAFYTDEEKAEEKRKLLAAFHPFKKTQRVIVISVVPTYCLAWFIAFTMACFGMDITSLERLLTGSWGVPAGFVASIAFYLGGGVFNKEK